MELLGKKGTQKILKDSLNHTSLIKGRKIAVCLILSGSLALFSPLQSRSETYEELELSSRNLVLPEAEQFKLGSKLFFSEDKKLAAWKAFQTFLFNYPDSRLAGDAQFMLAESIYAKSVSLLRTGTPPDELGWRKVKKGGFKKIKKGFKKSFEGLKSFGATVSGEPTQTSEPDRIDLATFSEAIDQYSRVIKEFKKRGLSDTAYYRIAESYYNMGDYPNALKYFKKVQKDYPQSYLIGESILGAAQVLTWILSPLFQIGVCQVLRIQGF